jgi:hypothetical protein
MSVPMCSQILSNLSRPFYHKVTNIQTILVQGKVWNIRDVVERPDFRWKSGCETHENRVQSQVILSTITTTVFYIFDI